jgi:hypothetical protein
VHKGVYVIGNPKLTLAQEELAAVMAGGPGAALSHRSAARNHRIPYGVRARIAITCRTNRKISGVTVHRRRSFTLADTVLVDGVRVTTVRRTLIDLAPILSPALLIDAVGQARFRKQIGPQDRPHIAKEGAGRKRVSDLLTLLGSEQELRSELERRFHRLIRASARLCVELDSLLHHGDPDALENDRARDARFLVARIGVMRITWKRLATEPDVVVGQLDTILRV